MSKKYRIGYLDEDEGYQAKFYQAFKNEFDIKILPIENINNVYDEYHYTQPRKVRISDPIRNGVIPQPIPAE